MTAPSLIDPSLVALLEVVAFPGCAERQALLGFPSRLCECSETARRTLDRYDSAESDEAASRELHRFVEQVLEQNQSRSSIVSAALPLARDLTPLESNVFLWSILLEVAVARAQAFPVSMDAAEAHQLVDDIHALESQASARELSTWERGYRQRHPEVDPDALARQRWTIRRVTEIVQHVAVADRSRMLASAKRLAGVAGLDPDDVGAPWE